MMSELSLDFGLKANGLCFQQMFMNGICPSADVLSEFVNGIDHQLDRNKQLLESCLKQITNTGVDLINNTCMTQETGATDTVTVLKTACDSRLLHRMTCSRTNLQSILNYIHSLLRSLESLPGCEQLVLQHVLELSSVECLVLPESVSMLPAESLSVVSLHTVTDSTEHAVDTAWNQLCVQLRCRLIDRLKQLSTLRSLPANTVTPSIGNVARALFNSGQQCERRQVVNSLCALLPVSHVESQYCSIRQQQVAALFDESLGQVTDRKVNCETLVHLFTLTMNHVLVMMSQDFELFLSGTMNLQHDEVFDVLSDIYFEQLQLQVETVVNKLSSDLVVAVVEKKTLSNLDKHGSSKIEQDTGAMSKSPSDFGFFGRRFAGNVSRRQHQSHSADDLLDCMKLKTLDEFTDLSPINSQLFDDVVELIDCLLSLELQFETWRTTISSSWHNVVDVGREKKSRQRLKSALKRQQKVITELTTDSTKKSRHLLFGVKRDSLKNSVHPATLTTTQPQVTDEHVPFFKDASLADRPHIDWRSLFCRMCTDLAVCLGAKLHSAADSAIRQDHQQYNTTGSVPTVDVPTELITQSDFPQRVSVSTLAILQEFDRLLPLAKAGTERPLLALVTTFVDALVTVLERVLDWMIKLTCDSKHGNGVNNLYIVLSSLLFLRDLTHRYNIALSLDESSKQRLTTISNQYHTSCIDLISHIEEYHNNMLKTCLLRDADSHNWTDNKEFSEGERCSIDIDAWNVFMCGLRTDLWSNCSPSVSRRIFSTVLNSALSQFASRYAHIQPSRRRRQQLVADVTSILLCTSEFLFYACKSMSQYLDPCDDVAAIYSIHNYCCCLLSCLAVVAAPLDVIYRVYRKGFNRKSMKSDTTVPKGHISYWLSHINQNLFPPGKLCFSELETVNSLYLQLCLLMAHPTQNNLLLQALLMKNCHLSVILLTQISCHLTSTPQQLPQTAVAEQSAAFSPCLSESLFVSVVNVLVKCHLFPAALASALVPVINSRSDWLLFDYNVVIGKTHECPLWLTAVMRQLDPVIARVVHPGIELCISKNNSVSLVNYLNELSCQCIVTSHAAADSSTKPEFLVESLYSIVSQLISELFTVPVPIVTFLQALQDIVVEQSNIVVPFNSAGLKLLATCLRLYLLDFDSLEIQLDCKFSDNIRTDIVTLADCLYHILTCSQSTDKQNAAPKIAALFIMVNSDWLLEQIEAIIQHLAHPIFKASTSGMLNDGKQCLTEMLVNQQTETIIATQTGCCCLSSVGRFIVNNCEWVIGQLGVSTDKMCVSRDSRLFHIYHHGGLTKLNHAAVMNFEYNWLSLLRSDIHLNNIALHNLLLNRCELQNNVQLDDAEKRLVDILRTKYQLDTVDSVA